MASLFLMSSFSNKNISHVLDALMYRTHGGSDFLKIETLGQHSLLESALDSKLILSFVPSFMLSLNQVNVELHTCT